MTQKNSNSKTPPPKQVKKRMGYIVPIVFMFGVFIGIILPDFKNAKSNERKLDKLKEIHQSASTHELKYEYLNPLANHPEFRDMNMGDNSELEKKVAKYISRNAAKPGSEISVYFRDLNTNIKFGINEYSKFSPSSLMKVPVMIALLKKEQESNTALNQTVVYKQSRENETKGMDESTDKLISTLVAGQSYTMDQLLHYMILNSDNEATFLLLDYLNEEYVHQVERDLGFSMPANASFYGDIIGVRQYSSFFRILYNASYLNEEMSNYALEILSDSRFGHGIRTAIPNDIKVAHKYGSNGIPISNHELKVNQLHHFGIVYLPNKPFLLGIMTRGDNVKDMERHIKEITTLIYKEISDNASTGNCTYLSRDIN